LVAEHAELSEVSEPLRGGELDTSRRTALIALIPVFRGRRGRGRAQLECETGRTIWRAKRHTVTVTVFAPPSAYSCRLLPLRGAVLEAGEAPETLDVSRRSHDPAAERGGGFKSPSSHFESVGQ